MSSPVALAAVTATLRQLLINHLPTSLNRREVKITTKAPNQLAPPEGGEDELRVNLFLYHVLPNAAWRNQVPPGKGPGLSATHAPLALDAFYLLTVVAIGDETPLLETQQLLGQALAILHDIPILGKDAIRLQIGDPPLDFYGERVRIVPHALSVDEMSKLWSAFQAPYRLSAAVQASVILIDSAKRVTPAPPVLSRGGAERLPPLPPGLSREDIDSGTDTEAGLQSPYPELTAIAPADPAAPRRPRGLPVFEAGEVLRLSGGHLRTGSLALSVQLTPAGAGPPIELVAPLASLEDHLDVTLASTAPAARPLRSGLYAVTVDVKTDDPLHPLRTTNELPLLIAPRITSLAPVGPVLLPGSLTIGVAPMVGPGQRVSLLVGAVAIDPTGPVIDRPTLEFALGSGGLERGRTYPVRLRVDGVDSFPASADKPREFAYTVTIQ